MPVAAFFGASEKHVPLPCAEAQRKPSISKTTLSDFMASPQMAISKHIRAFDAIAKTSFKASAGQVSKLDATCDTSHEKVIHNGSQDIKFIHGMQCQR
jgi:hypothetical protein